MEFTIGPWGIIIGVVVFLGIGICLGEYTNSRRKANNDDDFSMREYSPSNEETKQTITVYNADGNIIKQYKGCLDVEGDDYSIIFDDENGRSHESYYSMGIVTVDEE